ncbi:MAG: cyclic nucleotide-binding domain-containing protein, partial [Pseudomonadota bacterium]
MSDVITNHRTSEPKSDLERIAWPQVSDELIAIFRKNGDTQRLTEGEVLFEVDSPSYPFIFVLEGSVCILDRGADEGAQVVVEVQAGNFVGELGMLMGQGTFLAGVAGPGCRAIVVTQERLAELVANVPEVSDCVVPAFAARRKLLIEWGEGALMVIGDENDPACMGLLEFIT